MNTLDLLFATFWALVAIGGAIALVATSDVRFAALNMGALGLHLLYRILARLDGEV